MYSLIQFNKHPIVTREAQELINFGASRHRVFELMPEKGVLTEIIYRPKIYYEECTNSTTLPLEASLLLNEVSHFPIKQFVIGHEYPKEQPKRELPEIPWSGIAKVIAIGMAGIVFLPFWILMAALSGVDPCLVAVLDDGQESWVLLAEWDE